jgi:glycyl-tRNA synthetase
MSDEIKANVSLEEIVSLAKRRAFVYQTSEIYGGLVSSYDYGPMGVEVLRKIKNLWWDFFISKREDMVGLDSQIMLHPETWVASGHVSSFTDPLVEDKVNHKRYRADHLIENWAKKKDLNLDELNIDGMSTEEMNQYLQGNEIKSPEGNPITEAKDFNILFETEIGSVAGDKSKVYLRGETAQGIFSNFKQIIDTSRMKLPFGVGQIGKSFRNEITTGQFVFRTLEFEQAEIEYFFNPEKENWEELFKDWQDKMWYFVTEILGIDESRLRWRRHSNSERSHYSKDTYTGEKFVPHVIEPAVGINRLFLMVLCDAYQKDQEKNRILMNFEKKLAPYQLAVFPLVKNKEELVGKAREIFTNLKKDYRVAWDERGNIGKRYLSQDEIGTPICITVDYQTLEDGTVTIRDRQSAEQERVKISELDQQLKNMLA